MPFDPQARLSLNDDADAWSAWMEELIGLFAASPEVEALGDQELDAWPDLVLQFAGSYHDQTLATLTPDTVLHILRSLIPLKVAVEPDEAGNLVREMRAFFGFAGRAFHLPNMADCAVALAPGIEDEIAAALGDTSQFGMAKSMFMGDAEPADPSGRPGVWSLDGNEDFAAALARLVGVKPEAAARPDPKAAAEKKAARKRQKKARKKAR